MLGLGATTLYMYSEVPNFRRIVLCENLGAFRKKLYATFTFFTSTFEVCPALTG